MYSNPASTSSFASFVVFAVDEWFQQNPSWRTIFYLLVIIGIIGIISAIIRPKGKWN